MLAVETLPWWTSKTSKFTAEVSTPSHEKWCWAPGWDFWDFRKWDGWLKSMSEIDGIILNPSTFKPRLRSTIRSVVFILRDDGSEMIRMFDCQIGSDSAKTAEFLELLVSWLKSCFPTPARLCLLQNQSLLWPSRNIRWDVQSRLSALLFTPEIKHSNT